MVTGEGEGQRKKRKKREVQDEVFEGREVLREGGGRGRGRGGRMNGGGKKAQKQNKTAREKKGKRKKKRKEKKKRRKKRGVQDEVFEGREVLSAREGGGGGRRELGDSAGDASAVAARARERVLFEGVSYRKDADSYTEYVSVARDALQKEFCLRVSVTGKMWTVTPNMC
eukprot:741235-Rhodomonas_salina.1